MFINGCLISIIIIIIIIMLLDIQQMESKWKDLGFGWDMGQREDQEYKTADVWFQFLVVNHAKKRQV